MSIWNDPEIGKYLSDPSIENVDQKYLDALGKLDENNDCCYMVAESKELGKTIGTCSYFTDEKSKVYDIAYSVHSDFWRQGYATEMVEVLLKHIKDSGGKRVTITIAQDNIASNTLARKFDFNVFEEGSFQKSGTDIVLKDYKYELIF
jgi:RimJ/RimL family protein N-acetyltransferase